MSSHEYPAVVFALNEEDGGGFLATAPDLKGCMGDGATQEEALADLRLAIGEWIDEANRLGRPVPKPGSLAEIAKKEEEQVAKLIEAQDNLLKEQDKLLKEARADIERIKERLAERSTDEQEKYSAVWLVRTGSVSRVSHHPLRRKHQELTH